MIYYSGIMLGLHLEMFSYNLDTVLSLYDNENYACYMLQFNKDELPAAIDTFKRAKEVLDECSSRLKALGFDVEEPEFSKSY